MPDNVTVDNGELTDFTVSADQTPSGSLVQRVKLAYGTDGSEEHVDADSAGLQVKLGQSLPAGTNNIGDVDVASVAGNVTVVQATATNLKVDASEVTVPVDATLQTGDNTVGKVKLTDGTNVAAVRDCGSYDALSVAIVDASGGHITSFGGTGGTSATDEGAFTPTSTSGTPMMGATTSDVAAADKVGVLAMTTARELKINVSSSGLDVDHDAADSGQPVALGARAANTLASSTSGGLRPVATDDRVKLIADLWGRLLVSHLDPNMAMWKAYNTTSCPASGAGAAIWTPTSGKKIAVTSLEVSVYGTTSGRFVIYWGDATYTAGTDQPLFIGSFAPSSTVKPGAVFPLSTPVYHNTADDPLRIHQLDGGSGMSVDVIVNGYEY